MGEQDLFGQRNTEHMTETNPPKQGGTGATLLQTLIMALVTVAGSYGAITSHIDATIKSEVQEARTEMQSEVDQVVRQARNWHTQAQEWHRRDSIAIAELQHQVLSRKGRKRIDGPTF